MPNAAAESDYFAPYESKSVPQRLKPSGAVIYGTAEGSRALRSTVSTSAFEVLSELANRKI
jgi:hypothetical protein